MVDMEVRGEEIKINLERPVAVITPTIGKSTLSKAIDSVLSQTYSNVKHHVVVDGHQYEQDVHIRIKDSKGQTSHSLALDLLQENTGANGFYGHRIYAAWPQLVNADYIFFLDEDNWYEPNHVKSLVDLLEAKQGYSFAHSFRRIYDKDGKYICDDLCESLGSWPIWHSHTHPEYLIDTSSFAFRKEFIMKTSPIWNFGWGGDRHYLASVKDSYIYGTTALPTLCYRLDGNPGSVTEDFFIKGNKQQEEHYEGKFPWTPMQ